MEKLKKLFPISFKFNKSIGSIALGALIYVGISIVAGWIIGLIFSPITSVISIMSFISAFIWLLAPIVTVLSTAVGFITSAITMFVNFYIYTGVIVSILSYAENNKSKPEEEIIIEEIDTPVEDDAEEEVTVEE